MRGSTAFFCSGIIEKFSPGSRRFAPFFSTAAQRPLFFVALHATFSPRPLHCHFFRGFAPQTHHGLPRFGGSRRFMPKFSPCGSATVLFGALRAQFFTRPHSGRFFFSWGFVLQTHFSSPLRGLAALLPQFFPGRPRFFPGRFAAVFFPGAKCSVLAGYLTPALISLV